MVSKSAFVAANDDIDDEEEEEDEEYKKSKNTPVCSSKLVLFVSQPTRKTTHIVQPRCVQVITIICNLQFAICNHFLEAEDYLSA